MKLSARQKYDYRDPDTGEAQLIRIGHAPWRDRRKLGDTVSEREGINAALESVWKAKTEYRAELARTRAILRLSGSPPADLRCFRSLPLGLSRSVRVQTTFWRESLRGKCAG
jgi:hypothetical protein